MNKSDLVDEVKSRLDVSGRRARTLVDAVLEEMRNAVAEGQSLTLRGLGFTPDKELAEVWADATERPDRATTVAKPTEPELVPYEPARDPAADALAAVAAEQARPVGVDEPVDLRVLPTMAEPELLAEPDTLVYTSGDADTDETIGDLTAGQD